MATKAERAVADYLSRTGVGGLSMFKQWNTTTFSKPDVTAATAWTTANSPITLFTVTGSVLCRVYGDVTTLVSSTAGTGTLAVGITGTTGLYLAATTANGTTNLILNSVWLDNAPTVLAKALAAINSQGGWVLTRNANIILTIATNNMTAGGVNMYCDWIPVSAGASVV
jgi:hypothetical protein